MRASPELSMTSYMEHLIALTADEELACDLLFEELLGESDAAGHAPQQAPAPLTLAA